MKRPEYVAIVTRVYSDALREQRQPTREELEDLTAAFNRQGFTDGYYQGKTGKHMFGIHEKEQVPEKLFARTRQEYHREHARVPVTMTVEMKAGRPLCITAADSEGHKARLEGPAPAPALHRAVTEEDIRRQLERTGGTPYYVEEMEIAADGGLSIPLSALNDLRRRLLDDLSQKRIAHPSRRTGAPLSMPKGTNHTETPGYTVSLRSAEQLTESLIACKPQVIYLAPEHILKQAELVSRALEQGIEVCAAMPRILWDKERRELDALLEQVKQLGVYTALVGDLGALTIAVSHDFTCRGDFGLGVYNSLTLSKLTEMGLISATLSFEQRLARIRDLNKPLDTEIIGYGRLPLMITENCIIHNRGGRCNCHASNVLTDRTGAQFPVLKARGCRNEIFNSKKLFLADKQESYQKLGLWAVRLSFTTENPRECVQILERYQGKGSYTPIDITRGLYFRDVE